MSVTGGGEAAAGPRRFESYNVLVAGETITLEPFARFAEPGHLFNYSKSAIRSLEMMELFRHTQGKLRACDIGRSLGIGPSSTDQLLKTLLDGGYLVFDPVTKYYWPSPRIGALARGLQATLGIETLLDEFVRITSSDLRKKVCLAMSQGAHMQLICHAWQLDQEAAGEEPGESWWRDGTCVPMFGSSSGAAWLSTQTEEVILNCMAQCRRELGSLADDPERLLASLARVKEQGFAFGGISPRNDAWGVSMTLPPTRQGDVYVVAVSAPHAELERDQTEIVDYLRTKIALLREQAV